MGNKKINEILGISDDKGIDDFLADIKIDDQIHQLDSMDETVQKNVQNIDSQIANYNTNGLQNVDVTNIQTSLCEIKELIDVSKAAIKKIYDSIEDSELVDAEVVNALASLMESSHLSIKEYIDIYKDRMSFYDKIRLQMFKQQCDIEKMNHKHKLDMEMAQMKQKEPTHTVENMVPFSQESVIKDVD